MKKADFDDRDVVVRILNDSFEEDPHMNWLLDHSKHKNKFRETLNYVFEETMAKGEIYLNDQNNAAALWVFNETEAITLSFINRNIKFLLKMGANTLYLMKRLN